MRNGFFNRSLVFVLLLGLHSVLMANSDIENVVKQLAKEEDIPGMQYLVVNSEGVVREVIYGYQNIEAEKNVTTKTMFMLNSSTKVFTAAAIMRLLDQGKLKLTDSLSTYYPNHPYGREVTIRHLLNQTSGIPNPLPLKWLHLEEEHQAFDEAAVLSGVLVDNDKLKHEPGEKYAYSNISYWLLGKVVESVSGLSYCEYLREELFNPLEINSTELDCDLPQEEVYAYGYEKRFSFFRLFLYFGGAERFLDTAIDGYITYKRVYHNDPAYGGLYGNGRGVAKFLGDMLRDKPRLFSMKTKTLFFQQQTDNDGQFVPMTLGWKYGEENGVRFFEKPGGGPGSHSNIRIYPDRKMATLYLINKTSVSESSISQFSSLLDRAALGF